MEKYEFMTSLLTFYMKAEVSQERNFVNLKVPNEILGIIPLGARKHSIPVNQIAEIDTSFKLNLKEFLVGIIIAFLGMALMTESILAGFILFLIGVANVIDAFEVILRFSTTSGVIHVIPVLIFDKAKAEEAANSIRRIVAARLDDTNVRDANAALGDRLVDAIGTLKNDNNNK